ncbi:MAG: hypothetical protein IPM40_05290 [Gammaproteobacteria bacterium]|nr:hypothetical protein [Gammaproteobacteria bacterium]
MTSAKSPKIVAPALEDTIESCSRLADALRISDAPDEVLEEVRARIESAAVCSGRTTAVAALRRP